MLDGGHPARVIPIRSAAQPGVPGKIYVRETAGRYTNWRWVCIWVSQLVFYGLPWLNWGQRQIVLFDLVQAKFYLFGAVLLPQDGIYFVAILVICACTLFLSSAIGGRVWCGFACPHTVYTEIFMWMERKIEGGRSARMRLDRAPWSPGKLFQKGAKHGAWLLAAAVTGFTFVGYFTPIRLLLDELAGAFLGPWEVLWMALYGSLMYYNAGWMREQFCKYICPHARFQSVMTDSDTLVIAYDEARGEPRGLRNRKQLLQKRHLGDCVDCTLCVQVCPTGSDIRQGFHYECMGCGACIDACDLVMDKLGAPRGLIRYASANALRQPDPARVPAPRLRVVVYGVLVLAALAGLAIALAVRIPLRLDVMLDRGVVAREVAGGMVENVYRLRIMNADERAHRYRIRVAGIDALALAGPDRVELDALAARTVPVAVRAPRQYAGTPSLAIAFEIEESDGARRGIAERAVFPMPP